MAKTYNTRYVLQGEYGAGPAFQRLMADFTKSQRMLGQLKMLTAGAFSVAGLLGFIKKNADAERASARLTAAINAQGHAAGFTRKQLDGLADDLAQTTLFDDEDFRRAEARLLTIGNVYGENFERAIRLSADLATENETELMPALEGVGKALQNPIEGLKQYQKEIGKLDPMQRRMITQLVQQGDIAKAQTMLLDLLQGKVGGAAALTNSGWIKVIPDLTESFGELVEAIGQLDVVKGPIQGFFGFLTGSLRDMKSIIESGDWFGGLVFLLGGRGHDLTAQSVMALDIENVRRNLNDQRLKAAQSSGDPAFSKNATELAAKLQRMEAEYNKLYAIRQGKPAAPLTPKMGLTDDQSGFLNSLRKQAAGIDVGPIGSLEEQARQLGMLRQAAPLIGQIRDATAQLNDEQARGADRAQTWQATFGFLEGHREEIKTLKEETALLNLSGRERENLTRIQQFDNELVKIANSLSGEQREIFERQAQLVRSDLVDAMDEARVASENLSVGFESTMEDIATDAQDASRQVSGLFVNAFSSMEDALTDFTLTGKLNFRSLTESILSDLIRIQVQQNITAPIANFLAGQSSAVSGLFNFMGVKSGVPSQVTVGAPAPISPFGNYAVGTDYVPHDQLAYIHKGEAVVTAAENRAGRRGGVTVVQNFNISPGLQGTVQAEIMRTMPAFKKLAIASVKESNARGGG